MVLINLLPWRVQQQSYLHKLRRKTLVAGVVCILFMLVVAHVVLQHWVDALASRIAELKPQVNQGLSRRKATNTTNLPPHAFFRSEIAVYQTDARELIQQIMDLRAANICFTSISRYQNKVRFSGRAHTVENFSAFFSVWPAVAHFSRIYINHMKPDGAGMLAVEFEGIEKNGYQRHD